MSQTFCRRLLGWWLAASCAWPCLAQNAVAAGQAPPPTPHTEVGHPLATPEAPPRARGDLGGHRVFIRVATYQGREADVSRSLFTAGLGGEARLSPALALAAEWEFVRGAFEALRAAGSDPLEADHAYFVAGAGSVVRLGNPWLGLQWRHRQRGDDAVDMAQTATLGATAPVVRGDANPTSAEELAAAIAHPYANAMGARTKPWLQATDRLAVTLGGEARFAATHWEVAIEPVAAMMFCVAPSRCSRATDLYLIATIEGAARLADDWLLGGRLSISFEPTGDGDNAQLALEPFVALEMDGSSFEAALSAPLDGPDGFAFAGGGVWAASITAATTL